MFAPGALVAGRYRIVNLLGKGGMGEVYRADDLTLNQPVAMKFLPRKLASDQAALARFHSEVRVARNVAHPAVCRVFDIGESEGRIFLTMEYIDGEDLAALLRRIGRLPSDKATELARQICAGVGAAHDAGVIHRDLKPANIMVDSRGRAHVTDFGVAGLADDLTEDSARAGTPAYMAPEQLAGSGVSVQSDVFSLGLILYEMFTGKRAFKDGTIGDLMRAHRESAPSRPSTLIGEIDAGIERVILRCLAREPAARPRTALDVARALPGGDPLAAALAAGETPSPEMVAASGGVGTCAVFQAWTLLSAALVLLIACLAVTPWSSSIGLAPPENSPDVMTHRAQELIRKFGYKDPPKDSYSLYWYNYEFLVDRNKKLPASRKSSDLKSAQQGPFFFMYRQSPVDLLGWYGFWTFAGRWYMTDETPPETLTNMATVFLQPDGSLTFFTAMPPQAAPPGSETPPAPDWDAYFAESGLDPKRFEREPPYWISPRPFDASVGWKGTYAQDPSETIHVSAATHRGRLVYFQVIGPWMSPTRDVSDNFQGRALVRWKDNLIAGITLAVLLGVAWMLWGNLKQGRGDLKGAFRLAVFVLASQMFLWLCNAHHQSTFNGEWLLFSTALALAFWMALLAWGLYVALEPFVRRRMPELLTSWTRMIGGGWRDPLVGRHVLIGVVTGLGYVAAIQASTAICLWFNLRVMPRPNDVIWMSSFPVAISGIAWNTAIYVVVNLAVVFFLFLVCTLTKRRWMAEIAVILLFAPVKFFDDGLVFAFIWAACLALLCRVGMLALVAFEAARWIEWLPLTYHPSHWFFPQAMVGVMFCVVLALYGFYVALGDKPAFGGGRGVLSFSDE